MTPDDVLAAVRRVFGVVDLDAASDDDANIRVGAHMFLDEDDDALKMPEWPQSDSVFLNPPGGKRGNESLPRLFWEKFATEMLSGRHGEGIFLAFSLEALSVCQSHSPRMSMLDFPFCVPRKRLRFVPREGKAQSPTHANAIIYRPGRVDRTDRFVEVFSSLGKVRR